MALYEYSRDLSDDILTEATENIFTKIFKAIQTLISNIIESINVALGKKANRDDLKNSEYGNMKLKALESRMIGSARTTLDKGLLLADKVISGLDIPDETINEFCQGARKTVTDFTDDIKKNGAIGRFFSARGYSDTKKLLLNTDARIKEDARKLYNKRTDKDKKRDRQVSSIILSIQSVINLFNNV